MTGEDRVKSVLSNVVFAAKYRIAIAAHSNASRKNRRAIRLSGKEFSFTINVLSLFLFVFFRKIIAAPAFVV
ncbi:MAG: hypothetical protein Q4E65_03840, partial [Clostridia bacterium]|nr:hypothetical protein [Clostridia bacterium]